MILGLVVILVVGVLVVLVLRKRLSSRTLPDYTCLVCDDKDCICEPARNGNDREGRGTP